MKKIKINAINNILIFISFVLIAISGLVLKFELPQKNRGAGLFWGWQQHDWLAVHDITGLVFTILIIVHLLLHVKWIRALPQILGTSRKK